MIPEPHRTYVLELFQALGELSDAFVLAGGQALKFHLPDARATRDMDFVLDVVQLQDLDRNPADVLTQLGYTVVEGSRFFQFEKDIPGSHSVMRIEFMAPDELKRGQDIRVKVNEQLHARACVGGTQALDESKRYELVGTLPDGQAAQVTIRVAEAHSLVMLKLLAMDDRYRNIRGPKHAQHDRDEAAIHTADIAALLAATGDMNVLARTFAQQFRGHLELCDRILGILMTYFEDDVSPGAVLYDEFLSREQYPADTVTAQLDILVKRAAALANAVQNPT